MHFHYLECFFFDMIGYDLEQYIEHWAPKAISWQKDNVGLQAGNPESKVNNILLCLEVDGNVIDAAIKKKCNYIVSHHPLLFQPIRKLDLRNDRISKLLHKLLINNITLFSFHTNLDFTTEGVSFQLARKLGLKDIKFLVNQKDNLSKIVIFTPEKDVDAVSGAVFSAGGGIIGGYSNCSFRSTGEGTFKGASTTNPVIGKAEEFTETPEVKLEFIIDSWKVPEAIKKAVKVHSYEEPAYDIYPLQNENTRYGEGAIGLLEKPVKFSEYLDIVAEKLNIKNFKYCKGQGSTVYKVAVCGGAGSEFLKDAIRAKADSFITADIKYHTYEDAAGVINLIDAGHYETEVLVLTEVKKRIETLIKTRNEKIKVFKYNGSTNPVIFYNK